MRLETHIAGDVRDDGTQVCARCAEDLPKQQGMTFVPGVLVEVRDSRHVYADVPAPPARDLCAVWNVAIDGEMTRLPNHKS